MSSRIKLIRGGEVGQTDINSMNANFLDSSLRVQDTSGYTAVQVDKHIFTVASKTPAVILSEDGQRINATLLHVGSRVNFELIDAAVPTEYIVTRTKKKIIT
jgi:hypothetical protein